MANIKILQTPEFLTMPIPSESIPKRFAIATNILLSAKLHNGEKGLLLFNYEPQKWNQWYPYFSSVNAMYAFDGVTYGDIVNIFQQNIMPRADVQNRVVMAEHSFLELLGVQNSNILLEMAPVEPEMWLKYSKTQNLWTFYYMEFLQVKQLPKINFECLDSNIIDFMPLSKTVVDSVLKTGKYRGIDVVDNTLDILKDQSLFTQLMNSAISL